MKVFKIRRFSQFVLLTVLCASVIFAPSLAAQANQPRLTREQAISHLESLVNVYQIQLSPAERDQVVTVCRQIQAGALQNLNNQLATTQATYDEAANNINQSIRFISNALSAISEDGSSMDLASFYLTQKAKNLRAALGVYQLSLEELLIIDCQVYPEAFVAGVEEARERKKLSEQAAEGFAGYIDGDLKQAFKSVRERLEQVEGAQ